MRVVGIDTLLLWRVGGTEVDVAIAALEDKTPGVHLRPRDVALVVPSFVAAAAIVGDTDFVGD